MVRVRLILFAGGEDTNEHLAHASMLIAPFAVFGAIFAIEWRRGSETRVRRRRDRAVDLMAFSALVSGGVHLLMTHHHFVESTVLGAFFLALGVAQIGLVVALLILPRAGVVLVGVGVQLSVVLLWIWTRAISVPFGLGHREAVGLPDLVATTAEIGGIAAGLFWLYRATGGWPSPEDVPWSKCETSTVRNSPPPRKVSTPSGL